MVCWCWRNARSSSPIFPPFRPLSLSLPPSFSSLWYQLSVICPRAPRFCSRTFPAPAVIPLSSPSSFLPYLCAFSPYIIYTFRSALGPCRLARATLSSRFFPPPPSSLSLVYRQPGFNPFPDNFLRMHPRGTYNTIYTVRNSFVTRCTHAALCVSRKMEKDEKSDEARDTAKERKREREYGAEEPSIFALPRGFQTSELWTRSGSLQSFFRSLNFVLAITDAPSLPLTLSRSPIIRFHRTWACNKLHHASTEREPSSPTFLFYFFVFTGTYN